jgi:CHAD domain-containing protein
MSNSFGRADEQIKRKLNVHKMNKKKLTHTSNRFYRDLKKCAKQLTTNFDTDAIHRFRVVYKKLRAFLRMISSINKTGVEIKISKKVKRAYHISGTIRDLQLQQQRILESTKQEFRRPQAYLDLLQQTVDKLMPELAAILQDKPVDKCKKKTTEKIPGEFSTKHVNDYAKQIWEAVYSIIASRHLHDAKIHTVRKNLKDLFYNLNVFGDPEPAITLQHVSKVKDEHDVEQLLEDLGSFQDKCTAITLLDAGWLNGLNAYNRKILMQTKKAFLKDKEEMKQLLIKKLQLVTSFNN